MPTAPDTTSPSELAIATRAIVICFIMRLVCTRAVALMINDRNITLDRLIRRWSPKVSAINGAHAHRMP